MIKPEDALNTNTRPGVSHLKDVDQMEIHPETASQKAGSGRDTSSKRNPLSIDAHFNEIGSEWPSMIGDLLNDLDGLGVMLRYALQHKSWLNAYLLAAGMNQVVEDYIHTDPLQLGRAAKNLDEILKPFGPFLANSIRSYVQLWTTLNGIRQATQITMGWQRKLSSLVSELANLVIDNQDSGLDASSLVRNGEALIDFIPKLPVKLRSDVIRLPSCFRSFDQRPEDLKNIIEEFADRWSDRRRMISVVGVRTSGSYLAPLYVALLKSIGYQKVGLLTFRPGGPFTIDEEAALHQLIQFDGLALLCDDPPITGSTLNKVALELEDAGISRRNIILLLQLFSSDEDLQGPLVKYQDILMGQDAWSIHKRLDSQPVKEVLSEALDPKFLLSEPERLLLPDGAKKRQHMSALYHIKISDPATNQAIDNLVRIEGIGLGYFGEHTMAVTGALPSYSAPVIAVQDGLLFQQILPPSQQVTPLKLSENPKLVDAMVRYVWERSCKLPARDDTSLKLDGRNAVWEVASNMLSKAFGRGWLMVRKSLIDPYVKEILRTDHPSIIDGDMALHNWFIRDDGHPSLIKLHLAERDFSHFDLYCYDPIYDLASLAIEVNPEFKPVYIRQSYESIAGERISPERWVLYQLVRLWDLNRQDLEMSDHYLRRMAQVLQDYYSEIYFQDLKNTLDSPVCALDIDGVLETRQLDFPSLSPSSAKSLRALNLHGYRVVLATGRCLGEVKERCAAYHLAGGVAEYGAVLYDHSSGQVLSMLTESEHDMLYELRCKLSNIKGIYLDPGFSFALRAYHLDENGRHKGLNGESIIKILQDTHTIDFVQAVTGVSQTDFTIKRIDKGYGLKEWLVRWNSRSKNPVEISAGKHPIALAVGDRAPDLPMFELAQLAFAPANASLEVKQAGIAVTSRAYQRGLEQAVSALLGHKPGDCPVCHQEAFPPETVLMQEILAAQENGRLSMLGQAMKLFLPKLRQPHVGTK